MAGKKSQSTTNNSSKNIDFWNWANNPATGPLPEWNATPEQLGWDEDDSGDHDGQPNWQYDKPLENKAVRHQFIDEPRIKESEEDLKQTSLSTYSPEQFHTFRAFALDKISSLNPGNCDGGLRSKIYDAIQDKENWLSRHDRLDERGRPLDETGAKYKNYVTKSNTMQEWFDEAMLLVDRILGIYADNKFVEASERLKDMAKDSKRVRQKLERKADLAQTAEPTRLGPYRVAKRPPEVVAAETLIAMKKAETEAAWRRKAEQERQEAEEAAAVLVSFCRTAVYIKLGEQDEYRSGAMSSVA